MNRNDIICMARDAKIPANLLSHSLGAVVKIEQIERFAALVAAAEREACARLCEDVIGHTPKGIAAIIRARGDSDE